MNTPTVIWERYRNQAEPALDIDSGLCLLPEVLSLGCCKSLNAFLGGERTYGLPSYELGFIDKGGVEWWLDNELEEIGPGSLFITKPGEHQGGMHSLIHPCKRYWVRFCLPQHGLPGIPNCLVDHLRQLFSTLKFRHFPGPPELKHHFNRLLDEHRRPRAFSLMMARAALHQIIVETVRAYHNKVEAAHSSEITKAIHWLNANDLKDCKIKDLAKVAGLSVGYFHERFVREVGYTPNEFLNRRRIYLAKLELVRSSKTITQVAFGLGFSSSQYFATVFKKLVGLTPQQYRQLNVTTLQTK